MSDQIAIGESARCEVVRFAHQILFDPRVYFKIEHWREGKLISMYDAQGLIVNEGKNRLLNVVFRRSTCLVWFRRFLRRLLRRPVPSFHRF